MHSLRSIIAIERRNTEARAIMESRKHEMQSPQFNDEVKQAMKRQEERRATNAVAA